MAAADLRTHVTLSRVVSATWEAGGRLVLGVDLFGNWIALQEARGVERGKWKDCWEDCKEMWKSSSCWAVEKLASGPRKWQRKRESCGRCEGQGEGPGVAVEGARQR